MTQQQRKQKLNEKLTNLRVRVAFTSIKSLEREATKLASEFSDYTDELSKELEAQRIRADKAEQEAKHQENRALRYSNDYHEACRFQLQYGRQAELAEQERDKLIKLVDTLDKAVNEDDESEWDYFAILIRKQITAYREGSNTDAKRD